MNYEDTFGRKIKNDNLKDFRGFLKGVYDSMFLVLKDNAPAYVCYAERTVIDFRTVAVESGFEWRNTLIWLKDVPAMNFGHYTWIYEPILYLAKGSPQFYGKPNHPNLLEAASTNSFAGRFDDKGNKATRALHPNQKPTKIIITPIENSSKSGDLLFEPFGGSGSTLIACEKTDRRCFAMELDPVYVDVIIARWEEYTGAKAVKLGEGCTGEKLEAMRYKLMRIAYIAGPYRASTPHGILQNVRKAEAVAIKYWQKGYAVICPHKNSALFDGLLPDEVWLEGYLAILARCDVCVMLPGWENSEGARKEHDFARAHGIEIVYEQAAC